MSISLIVSMDLWTGGVEAGPASGPSSGPTETEGHGTSKGEPPPLLGLKHLVTLPVAAVLASCFRPHAAVSRVA